MREILFVCSGNTCRSPMAEGIARKFAGRLPFEVRISSAGASALDGQPASETARQTAQKHGIDLSGHRSRNLNATMVREASLIVTMTGRHQKTVGIIEPKALAYTMRLTDFCDRFDGDVADPVGGGEDVYQAAFEMIEECIGHMMARIASSEFDGWRRDGRT